VPAVFDHELSAFWLIWARCLPVFLVLPWLLFRAFSVLALALSVGFACTLAPLVSHGFAAPDAALWPLFLHELVRGSVVAIGCAAPFVVLAVAAGIVEGYRAEGPVVPGGASVLARAAALAGLAVAASRGFLGGSIGFLLDARLAQTSGAGDLAGLLRELAQLLMRAITLGVSFSAPVLLGLFAGAIVLGILGRVAGRVVAPLAGPALVPYFGLALLCLCAANWLDAVPALVRTFAGQAARLLSTWR
jgi:type III secretory pathway component EscT